MQFLCQTCRFCLDTHDGTLRKTTPQSVCSFPGPRPQPVDPTSQTWQPSCKINLFRVTSWTYCVVMRYEVKTWVVR